jgi:uncharacterized protein YggU (UPF0235/DUF167 family)
LSTRASESTLADVKTNTDKLDILLSQLRDSITAASPNNKTLNDLYSKLNDLLTELSQKTEPSDIQNIANPSNLDVALSTRASETTLSGIKSQTDKFSFDASNRLAIQNEPNIDVLLSTRASETTLSSVKTNTDKLDVNLSTRATETTAASIKTNTDKLDVNLSTRASEATLSNIKTNTDNLNVNLSTRASEATLSTRASETTLSGVKTNTDKIPDSLDHYKISDIDDASNPKYYGFLDKDGNWYILKEDTTAKTYRYTKGATNYSTNWGNRTTLTYDYFDVVF